MCFYTVILRERSEESANGFQILRDAPLDDKTNGFQLKFKQALTNSKQID